MRGPVAAHHGTTYGEDAEAVLRAMFGLTAAVGPVAAAMAAVTGQLPLIGLPTAVLAMAVLCLAIALGPERVLAWLSRDAAPAVNSVGDDHGWIEDEPHRIG